VHEQEYKQGQGQGRSLWGENVSYDLRAIILARLLESKPLAKIES